MKSALAVSTAFSVLSATVEAYANPLSCSGKVAVHTAPSIQGPWTYKGAALPSGSKINKAGNQDLWAPDVSKVGSIYYLYYSVSSFGSQDSAIGVATSSTMDVGSWTDLGSTGVESVAGSKFNAIDGNLQVADGKMYMNFGSFWSDLFQIQMTATPTKAAKAVTSATQIAFVPTSPQAQEAAFGYKYGNYYYLFFSVDKSGKSCLEGGGTTVLESHGWVYGPGGQGVMNDPSLGPVLYYHYVDTRIGYADGQKQFGVNKLDFSSGWPVV
ncbi:hypothetical protein E8E11_006371 [Didymella keratinophila]|nr:hypothetical protein E8E11_006371 [Didymella keratinophila]